MKVINYFDSEKKEHWQNEIKRSDWGAGGFLHELLEQGSFFEQWEKNQRFCF